MWTYSGPGSVLSTSHISQHLSSQQPHEIVAVISPHFTEGETEAQREKSPTTKESGTPNLAVKLY